MPSPPEDLSPFRLLVLSHLLIGGEKGTRREKIQKDLEPLVGNRWSGGELTGHLDDTLEDLAAAGRIDRIEQGKGKKKTEVFVLTESGRERTLGALGLEGLPPKITWPQMISKYLAAVALGLRAPRGAAEKSFASAGGFKAAILRSLHELPVPESASLAQATDALLWKLLGRESADKFDVKSVKEFLILRSLGDGHPRPKTITVDPLIVRDLRPRNSKAPELRAAAVRRWLEGPSIDREHRSTPPTVATNGPAAAAALPLDEFARRVVAAARNSPTGRFGENKVFIAHVWRALRDDPDFRGMDLDTFKHRLTEANQARHLNLSRADLVEAMDPDDVRTSEASHFGAHYHFIRF